MRTSGIYATRLLRSRRSFVLCDATRLLILVVVSLGVATPALAQKYATEIYVGADVQVSLYTPTMFRVRVSHLAGEKFPDSYEIPFIMGRTIPWAPVEFQRRLEGGFEVIETSTLQIRISPLDDSWTVWGANGKQQIYPSVGPVYGIFRDGYTVFDAASAFDQKTDYSRFEHWFYNSGTGRYVDTFLADDLIFDRFFIYGPGYDQLFRQLKDLVGPEPLLRRKSYGFFQTQHLGCKGSQSKLMDVAAQFRQRHIPLDTLIVDYEWGDGCPGGDEDDQSWGRLDWAKPYTTPLSPHDMVARLHAMHYDVMLIQHSAPDFPHRAESIERDPKREWTSKVYPPNLWWTKLREKLDLGIDGIWQDTRKNDITDSMIWQQLQDYYGDSRRVLFLGNRNMVEVDPWALQRDDRFPSNSLLASRRYPFRWTGDAHTTWSELQWHIDAITNTFGPMSGVDYITADGYSADWKQQARWNQFLAFTPVARSHTMKPWDRELAIESLASTMAFGDKRDELEGSTNPQSPKTEAIPEMSAATPAPTAENSIRKYLKLRYRLLPYLYSKAFEQYQTGFPILRPMVLAFPADPYCNFNRLRSQYMFGDAFLVAPVWADLNSMDIYLPKGSTWIDYWSKQVYPGGRLVRYDTSDATKLPLFVRSGSIIPMGRETEWIDPKTPDDPIEFDVYPAEEGISFTLYEDDGITTRYQSGQFATTKLDMRRDANGTAVFTIGSTQGNYEGKPQSRTFLIDLNLVAQAPARVLINTVDLMRLPDPIEFSGAEEGWMYDPGKKVLMVKVRKKAEETVTVAVANIAR